MKNRINVNIRGNTIDKSNTPEESSCLEHILRCEFHLEGMDVFAHRLHFLPRIN